jgi:hypothetical protein
MDHAASLKPSQHDSIRAHGPLAGKTVVCLSTGVYYWHKSMGLMKTRHVSWLAFVCGLGLNALLRADPPAKVTEAVNDVVHGTEEKKSPATVGTEVYAGESLETGSQSRAEMLLPTTSITRMGSNTIYNYSPDSNTIDLQAGTILFCKPKDARQLNIKTTAVTAGITGTTGFVSVQGNPNSHQKTYIFGIVEGHATARANGQNFSVGAGDILEFKMPNKPFIFAFDVPRFVKSSPLLTRFKSRLPNQSEIDAELASYQDDVSRGFIQPPRSGIDYSTGIPILSTTAYDSAQSSQGQSRGGGASGPAGKPLGSPNPSSQTH